MVRQLADRATNRRNRYPLSNIAMAAACALLGLIFFFITAWPSGSTQTTKVSTAKPLKSDQLKRSAVLSDGSENYKYFYEHILTPFLRVRVSDTKGNEIVQQHIVNRMTNLGWQVDKDSFVDETPFGPKTFTNIIATQNPEAARQLVLACHFDSKYFKDFDFIGATDSAVPCAIIIDIARLLNSALESSTVRDVSLQLLFFDGEEAFVDWTNTDSLYGSRHLAAQWAEQDKLKNIELFILLDLIGSQSTVFRNFFPATEKLYERMQKLEMRLGKEGLFEPADVFQSKRFNTYFSGSNYFGGIADDHLPFLNHNVPIIHLITAPFPSVWHTKYDDATALHNATINNVGKVLRSFVVEYLQLSV